MLVIPLLLLIHKDVVLRHWWSIFRDMQGTWVRSCYIICLYRIHNNREPMFYVTGTIPNIGFRVGRFPHTLQLDTFYQPSWSAYTQKLLGSLLKELYLLYFAPTLLKHHVRLVWRPKIMKFCWWKNSCWYIHAKGGLVTKP